MNVALLAFLFCICLGPQTTPSAQQPRRQAPDVQTDGRVTFRLRAPAAKELTLRGERVTAGGIDVSPAVAMTKDESGVWSVTTEPLAREVFAYSFTIDGVT